MPYNPYNFIKDKLKNELRPQLKITASYSQKLGKTLYLKNLRECMPPDPPRKLTPSALVIFPLR